MRSTTRMAQAALLAVALLAGCGSSSSGTSGGKDAATGGEGLSPTNKLADLSRAAFNQLCDEEKANGNGKVSCGADGAVTVNPLGVCTSVIPDCSATVADSQSCAAAMNADACDPGAENADLKSPACLVMLACVSDLCTDTMCFCPDANSLQTCLSTCKTFTAGLTIPCAACIAGLYGALSCPDFSALAAPYDQCAATCGHADGGAGKG